MTKFKIALKLKNIGPHYADKSIDFIHEVDSNKAVFFAANGTGKSFICRAFRLCSALAAVGIADDILSIGNNEGHMHFEIQGNNSPRELHINIKRGVNPSIQNNTDYIFHVFNSDYVEENIRQNNYTPDGHIEGYILGKEQIDLSQERQMESRLDIEVKDISEKIDNIVAGAKSELQVNGVASNTNEFKQITRENVEKGFDYEDVVPYENVLQQLSALENVPEDLEDIDFSVPSFQLDFLDDVTNILETVFPKSEWDDDFIKEYKAHQSFIEDGLDADHSSDICPFCKRKYNDDARRLIEQYKKYRSDKESQVINKLSKSLDRIDNVIQTIKTQKIQNSDAIVRLEEIKRYFPSLNELHMENMSSIDSCILHWNRIGELIKLKIQNLCIVPSYVTDIMSDCRSDCEYVIDLQNRNSTTIQQVNKIKNNSNAERLTLRRNLCKSKAKHLHTHMSELFEVYNAKVRELQTLRSEIEKKEQRVKVSKRDKVYETLEMTLDNFFRGKYQIDKDTFQIRFQGDQLENNPSRVLSDGEKNIVALCWYLAETHLMIDKETDYNKLFFIIDDPISSMDFYFVYSVASLLKKINSIFSITSHERIWVFTHNIEFFSIVVRNNIITTSFLLTPGRICPFDHKLLLPYENHLFDLFRIAERNSAPNHTTGNSIRHVIETIAKFENPVINIKTYVDESTILKNDPCILSLCQDLSHGNARNEIPYTEDILRAACKTIIEFVKHKYPKQIEEIRKIKE